MEDTPELERKERERAARYEEAARIVREAEAQSRVLTVEEDARVLDLMTQVQNLEEQIGHMRRHHEAGQSQKGSENQC
jgi:hypothetical protein